MVTMSVEGRGLSSSKGRVIGLHGASAEKRRRTSTGNVAFQPADVEFPRAVDNRHSMPSGEVLPGFGTPVPPTPSPGCPPSVSPAFTPVSLQAPAANSALLAAQQMCELNQESQTSLSMDHRSPSSGDTARQDLLSPPVAANGASVELRRGDIFTEQVQEQREDSQQNRDSGNGQHTSPDNGAPLSGSRYASSGLSLLQIVYSTLGKTSCLVFKS